MIKISDPIIGPSIFDIYDILKNIKYNKDFSASDTNFKLQDEIYYHLNPTDNSFNIAILIPGALPGTITVNRNKNILDISFKLKLFPYLVEADQNISIDLNKQIDITKFDLYSTQIHFNNGVLNIVIPQLESAQDNFEIEVKY